jgi:uncharacterized protein (DUF1499 family)
MADAAIGTTRRRGIVATYGPWLSLLALIVSLVLLALVPVGFRAGWWPYGTSFAVLMPYSAYAGIAAAALALVSVFWWRGMTGGARLMTIAGFAAGAFLIYWPLQFYARVWSLPIINNTPLPRIHDITTDTENPPVFAVTLAAREAEKGGTAVYGGPELAKQQLAGYPDIVPLKTPLAPEEAFKRALATAQGMSGWMIVKTDPAARTIEGSERSLFMGFTDDFVIRVSADGTASRIDMRSESRQGRSDLGANAKRIRAYLGALKPTLG